MKQALVIIDVQNGMFSFPEMKPFDGDATVERIGSLLDRARDARIPVIFVQHEGEPGHPLAKDGAGFAFHSRLTPDGAETVIVKRHCNAFQETDIADHLRDADIGRLIVCGMQSQYCVDTFVRAAVERGLKVQLVSDGHTTFGTDILSADQIIAHHNNLLEGSFAELVLAEDVSLQ